MVNEGVTPVAGTGPYMFESYNSNMGLVLVRNPHFVEWNAEAQPDQAFITEAPLCTPNRVDFPSKRVGNFIFSNLLQWQLS